MIAEEGVLLYEWSDQFATCCLCNGLFLSQVELTVATTQFRRHY